MPCWTELLKCMPTSCPSLAPCMCCHICECSSHWGTSSTFSFLSLFFNHESTLDFVHFFSTEMACVLYSPNILGYINWFSDLKPISYSWNESYLTVVHNYLLIFWLASVFMRIFASVFIGY
jgi:hypothetical protein